MTDAEIQRCRRDGQLLWSVVSQRVKLKRSGLRWKGCCPFHADSTPSFTVYNDGHFHCFGCGAHGTIFDYVMLRDRVEFAAAAEIVAAEAGLARTGSNKGNGNGAHNGDELWQSILPAPTDAPRPTDQQLRCDVLHEYCDVDDRVLWYVRRHEAKGSRRKQFIPLTFGVLNGKRGWHDKAPQPPRPLYGLNRLSHAATGATLILCEGEKAADAAQRLFPGMVAMTWPGGSNAEDKVDFGAIAKHSVILWPDADQAGRDVMSRIAQRLSRARIVDTTGLSDGYDAADLEYDGIDDAEAWLRARLRQPPAPHADWPDPVYFFADQRRDAPVLGEHHVPAAIWPFISDTAERLGVATSSVALAAVVSLSAAISEQWQLQPKRSDYLWIEAARLWGVIVGPPSILKSPIIATTTAPIERLEVEAHKAWQEELAAWRERQAAAKEAKEKLDEPAPRRDRYLVESATIEALQEVLRDDEYGKFNSPLNKVLVRVDELSELFAGLDRYTTATGGSDRGAYLRLYNGGRYSIDRISRGSFSTRSWSGCLLGGIQPDPIQRIAKQAVDDGLLQRCMLDVPATQGPGLDRAPNWPAILAYRAIFPVLAIMGPARDAEGRPIPAKLHADAHAGREDVDQIARVMAEMPSASPRLKATFGKWPGLFARLSLTFHLVEIAALRAANNIGPPLDVISAETGERVRRYMREILLPNLLRGEAVMYASRQTDHATWIAGHILARYLDRITARDLMRYYKPLRAPEERDVMTSTMEAMATLAWVEPEPSGNEARPPTAWRVNPKVHSMFAELAEAEAKRREAIRAAVAGQNIDVDDVP